MKQALIIKQILHPVFGGIDKLNNHEFENVHLFAQKMLPRHATIRFQTKRFENHPKSCSKILREQYFATFGERLKTEKTLRLLTDTCDYPNNIKSRGSPFHFVVVSGASRRDR